MTRLSGWCSAPDNAIPMCAGCKVLDCGHACHETQDPALDKGSERQDAVESGTLSGPASTGIDRGPTTTGLE